MPMMDLTSYGFEVVARVPAMENDELMVFTKRGLKAKKTPGMHDEIFRIHVDLGASEVIVGVMENSVAVFQGHNELFYIFDYNQEILNVVAELLAKASKWPMEFNVDKYKLKRLGPFNYQSQAVDAKFLELLVEDGGDYSTLAFHAQVFDMSRNDCASDLTKEVSKAPEVLDLNEIKALLRRAIEEAK
jgi:hypothetical protein